MRARMIWGMMAALAAVVLTATPASAQGGDRLAHTLTVQVPAIMKVVVDPTAQTADGRPVLRVVTNVLALRALTLNGVAPEVLRRGGVQYAAGGHAKGGEAAIRGDTTVEPEVVRYTIVQP